VRIIITIIIIIIIIIIIVISSRRKLIAKLPNFGESLSRAEGWLCCKASFDFVAYHT